jgi:hypothetical protein
MFLGPGNTENVRVGHFWPEADSDLTLNASRLEVLNSCQWSRRQRRRSTIPFRVILQPRPCRRAAVEAAAAAVVRRFAGIHGSVLGQGWMPLGGLSGLLQPASASLQAAHRLIPAPARPGSTHAPPSHDNPSRKVSSSMTRSLSGLSKSVGDFQRRL